MKSDTVILWRSFFDSGVVEYHKALLEQLNPDYDIVKIDSHTLDKYESWYNNDVALYQWFKRTNPSYTRYIVLEWDVRCFIPLKDFFGDKWFSDFAVPCLKKRGIESDWHWFNHGVQLPEKYKISEVGVAPMACMILSHECISEISNYYFKNIEELKDLFCELRIGTLANYLGFSPCEISNEAKENITCGPINLNNMNRKSIYHWVKHL